jgi:DUF2934 family protein
MRGTRRYVILRAISSGRAMACQTLSAEEIKAAPVEARRWLERQIKRPFNQGDMPDRLTKALASNKSASNDSRTEGSGEMNNKTAATGNAAVRRLIAERAYELWENQGKPHGCDLIHWREAEQEIMDCLGPRQMDSVPEPFGRLRD